MEKQSIHQVLLKGGEAAVGYHAMLLALTRNIEDEEAVKAYYREHHIPFVVTEMGGQSSSTFQTKITNAVMGACLNEELIEKRSHDIHAVLHATEEAKRGILINAASTTNIILKIAIVRDDNWIAVAMFGESSMHYTTSHERCGLGVMHI